MTAHVVEATEFSVHSANQQQRFAYKFSGEIVSWIYDFVGVTNYLPCARKYFFFFGREDARVRIKPGGKCPGSRDIRFDAHCIFGNRHESSRATFYGTPRTSGLAVTPLRGTVWRWYSHGCRCFPVHSSLPQPVQHHAGDQHQSGQADNLHHGQHFVGLVRCGNQG